MGIRTLGRRIEPTGEPTGLCELAQNRQLLKIKNRLICYLLNPQFFKFNPINGVNQGNWSLSIKLILESFVVA